MGLLLAVVPLTPRCYEAQSRPGVLVVVCFRSVQAQKTVGAQGWQLPQNLFSGTAADRHSPFAKVSDILCRRSCKLSHEHRSTRNIQMLLRRLEVDGP